MKQIMIVIAFCSFLLTACQDNQKEHDAKVAQQAREELLKELKAQKETERQQEHKMEKQSKLKQLGFQKTSDGKIIIDMNRTKAYFQMLAEQMRAKSEEMHRELESGQINEKEAGIELNETHINIDLNKTKHFLDNLGKKMQGYVKEFEEMVHELNTTSETTK